MAYRYKGEPHKRIEGVVIESDIPLPENYKDKLGPKRQEKAKARQPLFPFAEMKTGDSLFVPGQKTGDWAHDRMKKHAKNYGKQFIARNVEGGMRMWRVS